jgi:hypothetical protein
VSAAVSFLRRTGPQTCAAGRADADIGRSAVGFGAEPLGLGDDCGAVGERMTLPHCGLERDSLPSGVVVADDHDRDGVGSVGPDLRFDLMPSRFIQVYPGVFDPVSRLL